MKRQFLPWIESLKHQLNWIVLSNSIVSVR